LLVAVVVLLGVFLYVLFNPPRNSVSSRDSSKPVPRAAIGSAVESVVYAD
jgi:hypothetical protein